MVVSELLVGEVNPNLMITGKLTAICVIGAESALRTNRLARTNSIPPSVKNQPSLLQDRFNAPIGHEPHERDGDVQYDRDPRADEC